MAAKKKDVKEKKEKKSKRSSKKYTSYEVSGDSLKRKTPFCPKCGVGVLMAQHKDRTTCGKCGYTEFKSKKE